MKSICIYTVQQRIIQTYPCLYFKHTHALQDFHGEGEIPVLGDTKSQASGKYQVAYNRKLGVAAENSSGQRSIEKRASVYHQFQRTDQV
jgi:hypothetical protein